jgi:SAM-dependent methyltransferase
MSIISHGYSGDKESSGSDPRITKLKNELREFDLGRFLLDNRGLNGRWTSYVLMYPDRGRASNLSSDGSQLKELESWLLNRCPIFAATQERFRIFRELTQPLLRSDMKIASLPSGLMDDLLTLDYSSVDNVEVTAIDLDPDSLEAAKINHKQLNTPVVVKFEQRDAWALDSFERWDLITSNGLNIYVAEDESCTDLYRSISKSLKPGGMFVMSFITPPDRWEPKSPEDLAQQRFLFTNVMPVRWSCVRDESKTRQQLDAAGFEVVSIRYDSQRMFPAVLARKLSSRS